MVRPTESNTSTANAIRYVGIALALLGREYWSLNRDKKRAAEEKRKQQQAAQPPAEG